MKMVFNVWNSLCILLSVSMQGKKIGYVVHYIGAVSLVLADFSIFMLDKLSPVKLFFVQNM